MGRGSRGCRSVAADAFLLPTEPARHTEGPHLPQPPLLPASGEGGGIPQAGAGEPGGGRLRGGLPPSGARSERSGGRPSLGKGRKGWVSLRLYAYRWPGLSTSVHLVPCRRLKEMAFVPRKAFPGPASGCSFSRGDRRALSPAAESSSSSGDAHMHTWRWTITSAGFPGPRPLALGQGTAHSW